MIPEGSDTSRYMEALLLNYHITESSRTPGSMLTRSANLFALLKKIVTNLENNMRCCCLRAKRLESHTCGVNRRLCSKSSSLLHENVFLPPSFAAAAFFALLPSTLCRSTNDAPRACAQNENEYRKRQLVGAKVPVTTFFSLETRKKASRVPRCARARMAVQPNTKKKHRQQKRWERLPR